MTTKNMLYFVKVAVSYMSYKVSATHVEQIDGPILYKLRTSSAEELATFLGNRNAEFVLGCLFELYAHGDGVKLLKLWEDPIIKILMEVDANSFYPLSVYGLMLQTLIAYCEMDS